MGLPALAVSAWIALAASTLGNMVLAVAVVNRLQSRRMRRHTLHLFVPLQYPAMIALPLAILWMASSADRNHPSVPLNVTALWHLLPWPLAGYAAACLVVGLVTPLVGLWRVFGPPPSVQTGFSSQKLCMVQRMGRRPVAPVGKHWLTRLPGNEVLSLEITEKRFRLPGLPVALNGISVLHISDLHFTGTLDRGYYEQVVDLCNDLKPELVAFTGDLLDRLQLLDWLPETLGRLNAPCGRFFVLGNHDWDIGPTEPTRLALENLGWVDLAGRVQTVDVRGQPVTLCGTEVPWMGSLPDLPPVAADADPSLRVLLSHSPDCIGWAKKQDIGLMLAGHVHGGQIRLPLFGPVYSPSAYGGHYACGAFWEAPTLLHVSRGVAGDVPLRWNCMPEITRIVLEA